MRVWVAALATGAVLLDAANSGAHKLPLPPGSEVSVIATAYCHKGRTESGERAAGDIIAADPRVLPVGSTVRILDGPRRGIYTVLDTGAAIKGLKIDILIKDCDRAKTFGKQRLRLRVLRIQ